MTTPDIDKLGKYRIESVLGRGAMGVVYKGFDPVIERWVAIKTIRKDIIRDAQGQEELARFRREAQAAGRISHPNIVTVYDFGEEGETTYIAMEYIEGKSLKDYLDNQDQFELATTVAIMKQLLSALDHSHRHGVIHRDIKPANIMMDGSLNVKVTDFGIARLESSTLTQAGTLMGTPSYMSPEQFMGVTVDNRTDIFSAGAVLYQLLTGDKPFSGSVTTIMHKVLNVEPPPPSALSVTVPGGFDVVIRKAMAKRPDDRFRTAADFAQALDLAFRGQLPAEAPVAAADATIAAPGPGGFDADATMAAGPAAADATMAAPRRQDADATMAAPRRQDADATMAAPRRQDADATMAAPRQQDADATMAAPRPQADADATMAAPRPQADADATMAAPRPQADADATMAAPRPTAATGPSAPPPRQAADPAPKRGLPVIPIAAGIVVLLLLGGGAMFLMRGDEAPVQVAGGTAPPPAAQPAPSAQNPAPAAQNPAPAAPAEATPPATVTPPQPADRPAATAESQPAASAPATPAPPAAAEPAAPAPSTQAPAPTGGSIGTGPLVPAPAVTAPAPPPAPQQAAPSPAAPPSTTAAAPAASAPAASAPAPAPSAPAPAAPAAQPAPSQGTQLAARTEPSAPAPAPAAPAAPPLTWATVADDVRRTLRDVPCSTLVGRLAGEDRLLVGGAVGTADTADTVRTRLASLGPTGGLDLNARPVGASHCGLLEALEPHADQLGEAGSGLAVGLAGDRTQLQDGDNLIVTLSAPRAGGSVYVYYVTLTGDAVRIFPATAEAAVRPAGDRVRIGEGELFIGEPFGTEMVVAVSSSGRLFEGLPGEYMSLDEFVPLLRGAFEQARGRGETVATAIEVLSTRPK